MSINIYNLIDFNYHKNIMAGLSPRQQRFAELYVQGVSATDSAKQAGYAPAYCGTNADKLLKNTNVASEIARLRAAASKKAVVDATWLLDRFHAESTADVSDLMDPLFPGVYKDVKDWPAIWRQGLVNDIEYGWVKFQIAGVDGEVETIKMWRPVKVKFADRFKRLESLGKHRAVKAFVDVQEHNMSDAMTAFFSGIKPTLGPPSERDK